MGVRKKGKLVANKGEKGKLGAPKGKRERGGASFAIQFHKATRPRARSQRNDFPVALTPNLRCLGFNFDLVWAGICVQVSGRLSMCGRCGINWRTCWVFRSYHVGIYFDELILYNLGNCSRGSPWFQLKTRSTKQPEGLRRAYSEA